MFNMGENLWYSLETIYYFDIAELLKFHSIILNYTWHVNDNFSLHRMTVRKELNNNFHYSVYHVFTTDHGKLILLLCRSTILHGCKRCVMFPQYTDSKLQLLCEVQYCLQQYYQMTLHSTCNDILSGDEIYPSLEQEYHEGNWH